MNKNKLVLSKEQTVQAIKEIQVYFLKEREEDLGIISATLVLEFFLDKIGTKAYNQGILDAIAFLNDRVEDLYGLER